MARFKQSSLLGVLVVVILVAGGAAWWSGGRGVASGLAVTPERSAAVREGGERADAQLEPVERSDASEDDAPTTVVWPLEVDLTLVQRGSFEVLPGVPPVGSGATATLRGNIYASDGSGERATVTFIAGPNEGRVLRCDEDGAYGASDLYGGLSIVDILTPAGRTAQREVLLREFTETPLTIGFGRPASVYGTVRDMSGAPLEGASVLMDGREALTDHEGEFHFPSLASGKVLAIVRKPGYATYREVVPVTAGFVITREKLTFSLERGASLAISIQEVMGDRGPAHVYLIPSGGQRVNTTRGQYTYPWYLVNPVEVYPGGTTLVEDLPEGRVDLALFHSGAVATPPTTAIKLSGGQERAQILHLEPGEQLVGTVTRDGVAVPDVDVTLEAPHRTRATTEALGKHFDFLQGMVLPHVAPACQRVKSDVNGRFVFSKYAGGGTAYYLAAETPDGEWIATRTAPAQAREVSLELRPRDRENGRLEIELEGRYQGLPVQVRVQGTPRDKLELAPRDKLVVADLEPGTWRLDLTWNGRFLKKGHPVDIGRQLARVAVDLPDGAIDGQNEFERKRAGKGP